METLKVELTFSPATRAELQSWAGALPPSLVLHSPMHLAAQFAQVRDHLEIAGFPEDPPLYVLGRALHLAPEGCRLVLALGLAHELT